VTSDGPERRRSTDYHQARIGAAAALVGVLVLVLLIDALSTEYEVSPLVVAAVLGTVGALVGIEVRSGLKP
jgi:hypothetical protein